MSSSDPVLPISAVTLAAPSRKMFIDQLQQLRDERGRRMSTVYGKDMEINVVWLQGHVTEINLESDYLQLSDGTGMVRVEHVTKVPGGCPVSSVGSYVMIIGDVTGQCGAVRVRALKVQDLSARGATSAFWSLEVVDTQLNS